MQKLFVSWSLTLLFTTLVISPNVFADPVFPALRDSQDAVLQDGLERSLGELGLQSASRRGTLSVALVDISDSRRPRMAAVNGDRMVYAASLPKIAILLGAYARHADGQLTLDANTRATLTRMIRRSSNTAATEMFNRVGPAYLAEVLQSPEYQLYDPSHNGGLWVGKPYGKGQAWKRDPLHNLSHGATALQTARFLYLLATDRLVSADASREMKDMLSRPAIKHKFVKGLAHHRPGSQIFRKSGTWRNWHADAAIVERDGRRYIAVALAEDPKGGAWLSRLIVALDDLVVATSPAQVALADGAIQ